MALFPLKPFAKHPYFDFMRHRHFWVGSSIVLVAITFGLIAWHGLNFGIDFVGGKLVQVSLTQDESVHTVRQAVEKAGFDNVTIQEYGTPKDFIIRLPGNDPKTQPNTAESSILTNLQALTPGAQIERVEFVGPQVGQELRTKGFLAVGISFLAIMVYIWMRFEMRYAFGAIASLFHDVILTVGVMAVLHTEITLTVLAAILTLIGYSLNDTIVIFDRIRENRGRYPNRPLAEILNLSVNQTLGRTIMTVSTVTLVLLSIFFFGGEVIHDFSMVLLVGVALGTYSSVFVASPVLLALEHWYHGTKNKAADARAESKKKDTK